MIFGHADIEDESQITAEAAVSIKDLLRACAEEAAHLAADMSNLDRDIAASLNNHSLPVQLAQGIDLARQEAEGLAGVLNLLASASSLEHLVEPFTLSSILRVRAQHRRISMRKFHDL